MIISLFKEKLTEKELQKVVSVCTLLQIPVNALLAVMYFETSKTFSPSIRNNIGSVGLIQFTRDVAGQQFKTINGKKYYLQDISKMTFIQQMDVVYEYFLPAKGKLKSFIDVYLFVFFPIASGKPLDFVFETRNLSKSLIATQNPIFDINKDGQITKGEVLNFFSGYYGNFFAEIQQTIDWQKIAEYLAKLFIFPLGVFFYTIYTLKNINII